jgi:type I restriction enzyme S subunit
MGTWHSTDLARLIKTIESGGRPKGGASEVTGEIPSLGGENIRQSGGLDIGSVKRIPQAFFDRMSKGVLQRDDVLVNKDGANTGKVGFYEEQFPHAAINEHLFLLRGKPGELTQRFLYYLLLSQFGQLPIRTKISGSAQPGLKRDFARNFPVKVPKETYEQSRIADVLAATDKAIERTELLVDKCQRIMIGLVQDCLSKGIDESGRLRDQATHEFKSSPIGTIPESWDAKPLREVAGISHGYAFSSQCFSDEDNGVILLTPGNFSVVGGLYFDSSNTKFYTGQIPDDFVLKNGDVLVVMTDLTKEMAILGNTVRLQRPERVLHNQRIGRVKILDPASVDPDYLVLVMNSGFCKSVVKATATGTTVRHTSPERIRSAILPFPAPEEQKAIASAVASQHSLVRSLLAGLSKLLRLKTGLMQDLLTGSAPTERLLETQTAGMP